MALAHSHTPTQKDKYTSMKACYDDTEKKHTMTLDACKAVKEKDKVKAATLFDEASKALVERTNTIKQYFHIVFVLDESGSMVVNRESARERANERVPQCEYSIRWYSIETYS